MPTREELMSAVLVEALSDVEYLGTLGFSLQEPAASPAVQQSGPVESSRPVARKVNPVGAGKSSVRSRGTPLIAKSSGAETESRPESPVGSPPAGLSGLF